MSISTRSESVRRALIGFLWRQWVQIGVFGEPSQRADPWAIDPESLLLLTLRTGGRDPRLFEETLDWLRANGTLMSLQRLRNLAETPDLRAIADGAVAWAGARNPRLRGWNRTEQKDVPELLQLSRTRVREPDPVLLAHGVMWPQFEPSGNSYAPDVGTPATLAFQLRLFFGLGSRAEVVRVMLTGLGAATAHRIAEATGFAKRNVHETLTALVEAGPVIAERRRNELVYTLHTAGWFDVLDLTEPIPSFLDWVALLRVLVPTVIWLDELEVTETTDYLAASHARDLIEHVESDLRLLGIRAPDPARHLGSSYLAAFDEILARITSLLRGERPPSPS